MELIARLSRIETALTDLAMLLPLISPRVGGTGEFNLRRSGVAAPVHITT